MIIIKKYIYISLGGFVGAISRHQVASIQIHLFDSLIPFNTLLINLSGSFLIALILTLALEIPDFDPDVKLGITTGFLGAYTTFSTLCREIVSLLQSGNYFSAISYIIVSLLFGLGMAYLGIVTARNIVKRKKLNQSKE